MFLACPERSRMGHTIYNIRIIDMVFEGFCDGFVVAACPTKYWLCLTWFKVPGSRFTVEGKTDSRFPTENHAVFSLSSTEYHYSPKTPPNGLSFHNERQTMNY